MERMRTHVHIDELVLPRHLVRERDRIEAALSRSLAGSTPGGSAPPRDDEPHVAIGRDVAARVRQRAGLPAAGAAERGGS